MQITDEEAGEMHLTFQHHYRVVFGLTVTTAGAALPGAAAVDNANPAFCFQLPAFC
jgi:hypothetical protein